MKYKSLCILIASFAIIACQSTSESYSTDEEGAIPIYTVRPHYPTAPRYQPVEGYVKLSFDVETNGKPTNIRVKEEQPKGYFTKNATKAIAKWRFKPKMLNGKPVKQIGLTYKLEFKLEE